jgi:alpha-glucosidase
MSRPSQIGRGELRIKSVAFILAALLLTFSGSGAGATEARLTSPDGRLAVVVTDTNGLRYRVEVDGKPVVIESRLGLEFKDGTRFGPAALVTKTRKKQRQDSWQNRFGQRRVVRDCC